MFPISDKARSMYLDVRRDDYDKALLNFTDWAKKNKIKESDGKPWVCLSPKFDNMKYIYRISAPPGCEHQEFFSGASGKRYYVYHPYPKTKKWDVISILDWATPRGISFEILSPCKSWYCPGKTFTVVMTLKDRELFADYVKKHRRKDNKQGGEWIVW